MHNLSVKMGREILIKSLGTHIIDVLPTYSKSSTHIQVLIFESKFKNYTFLSNILL